MKHRGVRVPPKLVQLHALAEVLLILRVQLLSPSLTHPARIFAVGVTVSRVGRVFENRVGFPCRFVEHILEALAGRGVTEGFKLFLDRLDAFGHALFDLRIIGFHRRSNANRCRPRLAVCEVFGRDKLVATHAVTDMGFGLILSVHCFLHELIDSFLNMFFQPFFRRLHGALCRTRLATGRLADKLDVPRGASSQTTMVMAHVEQLVRDTGEHTQAATHKDYDENRE